MIKSYKVYSLVVGLLFVSEPLTTLAKVIGPITPGKTYTVSGYPTCNADQFTLNSSKPLVVNLSCTFINTGKTTKKLKVWVNSLGGSTLNVMTGRLPTPPPDIVDLKPSNNGKPTQINRQYRVFTTQQNPAFCYTYIPYKPTRPITPWKYCNYFAISDAKYKGHPVFPFDIYKKIQSKDVIYTCSITNHNKQVTFFTDYKPNLKYIKPKHPMWVIVHGFKKEVKPYKPQTCN